MMNDEIQLTMSLRLKGVWTVFDDETGEETDECFWAEFPQVSMRVSLPGQPSKHRTLEGPNVASVESCLVALEGAERCLGIMFHSEMFKATLKQLVDEFTARPDIIEARAAAKERSAI